MWDNAVGWLIALLSLGAGAGWIVGGQTRALRRLKLEAELFQQLPESPGKDLLAVDISDSTLAYLGLKQTASLGRLAFWQRVMAAASVAAFFAVFGTGLWVYFHDGEPSRSQWAISIALSVFGTVAVVASNVLRTRLVNGLVELAGERNT